MRFFRIVSLFLPLFACCPPSAPPQDPEAVVATDLGTFRFEFAPDKAPKHVQQFLTLAQQGYYDGSAFFRVVANGTIQGGDPLLKNPKTARDRRGWGGLRQSVPIDCLKRPVRILKVAIKKKVERSFLPVSAGRRPY
ncbi:MAG: peptidylprolyl isomerase [Bryobacteraceae bacterium]